MVTLMKIYKVRGRKRIDKSEGQSERYTRDVHNYTESIVSRLHSRTLSGKKLGIAVHQHLGYKLHLVWGGNGKCPERCVERRFNTYKTISSFCEDLINGCCEGVCDCVGIFNFPDKADMCDTALFNSQIGIDPHLLRTSWVKYLQDRFPDKYRCPCRAISNEGEHVIDWISALPDSSSSSSHSECD
jgi:hypothetical protein